MELNAKDIIHAMECCCTNSEIDCRDCPYRNKETDLYDGCVYTLVKDALALIKQLTVENDRLREILHTDISFVCVSRGSGKTNHLKEVARLRMDEVRAYAVREMHSKIKDRCIEGGIYPAFVERVIDQIAKDMLEGKI